VAEQGVALKAAPQRVAYPDIPIPFTPVMEQWALPNADKIIAAFEKSEKMESH
jgi:pyruvate dehydrogenase E1 component beta subunit